MAVDLKADGVLPFSSPTDGAVAAAPRSMVWSSWLPAKAIPVSRAEIPAREAVPVTTKRLRPCLAVTSRCAPRRMPRERLSSDHVPSVPDTSGAGVPGTRPAERIAVCTSRPPIPWMPGVVRPAVQPLRRADTLNGIGPLSVSSSPEFLSC